MQMICIWSVWCHCHPIISCSSKIQNGLPFWCRLTQVVLEKRPLNRYSSFLYYFFQAVCEISLDIQFMSFSLSAEFLRNLQMNFAKFGKAFNLIHETSDLIFGMPFVMFAVSWAKTAENFQVVLLFFCACQIALESQDCRDLQTVSESRGCQKHLNFTQFLDKRCCSAQQIFL